jgi:KAP-like P-loop domain-containing protein/outer membrane protein with glycine zipper
MLLSDRPILCAAEDQLGFQPFCATLAKGLREMAPAEGMVVALHAPWGSGKTSALNLLQRHLAVLDIAELTKKKVDEIAEMAAVRPDAPSKDERALAGKWEALVEKHGKKLKTTVIRFNPWYFSGQENLFKAFFGVLGTELSIVNNSKVAKAVAAVLKRGDAAGSMLGAAAGLVTAGPAGAAGGATIGGFFGRMAGDKFDKKESLEASLQQLREALESSDRRLLIVIDDIDRLLPEELRQMLTLIKSLGNLPNVTYLLAFARTEVIDLINRAGISNAEYLEKIVQVSFELPRVDRYALRTMLFSRLDGILAGRELEDTNRWGKAFFSYIDPYLKTPRDVTRLCNALQVTWPAVQDEVDWTDLIVLEILRLHEASIYDLVLDKLGYLTGETASFGKDKEWADPLLPKAENSSDPKLAKEALIYLFPSLVKAWEGNSLMAAYKGGADRKADRNRRLQSAEYARNYFALAPATDQFTAAQIKNLFAANSAKEEFDRLFAIAKGRKTRQGLTMASRLIMQIKEQITPENKPPWALINAILARSDEIVRIRDSERMMFETDNDLRLTWLLVETLRTLPESERAAAAQEWFDGTTGGAFLVRFIDGMTREKANRSETLFAEVDHGALQGLVKKTVEEMARQEDFLRTSQGASLLFSWAHLIGYDEASKQLAARLEDDTAVFELAAIMPSEVFSSPGGLSYRIHRDAWSKLLDVDAFSERLRKLGQRLPSKDAKKTILHRYESALSNQRD